MVSESKWKEIAITLIFILIGYIVLNVTLPYIMADAHAGILDFFSFGIVIFAASPPPEDPLIPLPSL